MTPREFLEKVVSPNIDEFNNNYASMRHAHNAVATVDALAAHICNWCVRNAPLEVEELSTQQRDSHYRGRLAGQNPEFALLRDIANAQKHVHLTKPRRRMPEVSTAAQITVGPSEWRKYPWGEFPWDGSPQVGVTTDQGGERSVNRVAAAALAFLEAEMTRLNIP